MKKTISSPALIFCIAAALLLLPQVGHCFYNPSTGRWINRDPLGQKGGANPLAFVANDPVGRCDLLGLSILPNPYEYDWNTINGLLMRSKERFHDKLYALCPMGTTVSCDGSQVCTRHSCLIQAHALREDFARHLQVAFTTQFARFGNILAFTPPWDLFHDGPNERAVNAPAGGMSWKDYDKGYGLKCEGMQQLMSQRFQAVIGPLRQAGMQCFKGAEVGNDPSPVKASHKWFAIYHLLNNDIRSVDVMVDPWNSAGAIISPDKHILGKEKYWSAVLW